MCSIIHSVACFQNFLLFQSINSRTDWKIFRMSRTQQLISTLIFNEPQVNRRCPIESIIRVGASSDRTTFPKVTNDGSDMSGSVINDSSRFVFSRSLLTITVDVNVIHFINYRRPGSRWRDDDGRIIRRWSSTTSTSPVRILHSWSMILYWTHIDKNIYRIR